MDSTKLTSIVEYFNNKIDMIWFIVPLARLSRHGGEKVKNSNIASLLAVTGKSRHEIEASDSHSLAPDWDAFSEMMCEMKNMLGQIRSELSVQHDRLIAQNVTCHQGIDSLLSHQDYLKENIPQFWQKKNAEGKVISAKNGRTNAVTGNGNSKPLAGNQNQNGTRAVGQRQTTTSNANKNIHAGNNAGRNANANANAKSVVKKKNLNSIYLNPPSVAYITVPEFDSIPKYMRGRFTYEDVNRAIGDLNRTITSKYQLMSGDTFKYSDEEMARYNVYKEQENPETKGEFFCTENDLKKLSDIKLDNARKIMICLRHCQRIKEIRGPGKLVRFAVKNR